MLITGPSQPKVKEQEVEEEVGHFLFACVCTCSRALLCLLAHLSSLSCSSSRSLSSSMWRSSTDLSACLHCSWILSLSWISSSSVRSLSLSLSETCAARRREEVGSGHGSRGADTVGSHVVRGWVVVGVVGAHLSLQSADDDLQPLPLLLLLQQRLLQLLHPQLAVGPQLLLQAQLHRGLRGRLQGLAQLEAHRGVLAGRTDTTETLLYDNQTSNPTDPRPRSASPTLSGIVSHSREARHSRDPRAASYLTIYSRGDLTNGGACLGRLSHDLGLPERRGHRDAGNRTVATSDAAQCGSGRTRRVLRRLGGGLWELCRSRRGALWGTGGRDLTRTGEFTDQVFDAAGSAQGLAWPPPPGTASRGWAGRGAGFWEDCAANHRANTLFKLFILSAKREEEEEEEEGRVFASVPGDYPFNGNMCYRSGWNLVKPALNVSFLQFGTTNTSTDVRSLAEPVKYVY
ncbi:hypothetical protein EYF80_010845 [Liparis tanakae]|uniref:Uncharacterized protein n=1 Tax=Liparis tanakae TaxID=230148 RepID=A0A4Z2ILK8_9TELE|nr:hypothetical protein EYF80_010845 [Liparis tanakae]